MNLALYPSRVRSNDVLDGTSFAMVPRSKCRLYYPTEVRKVLPGFTVEVGENSTDLLSQLSKLRQLVGATFSRAVDK